MLDAHPEIWGMGEDSVFSGHLDRFLPNLLDAISNDSEENRTMEETARLVADYGKFVEKEMSQICLSTTGNRSKYIIDKHLANFMNVGE